MIIGILQCHDMVITLSSTTYLCAVLLGVDGLELDMEELEDVGMVEALEGQDLGVKLGKGPFGGLGLVNDLQCHLLLRHEMDGLLHSAMVDHMASRVSDGASIPKGGH